MIGDADGYTCEEAIVSLNNPFVIIITEALGKLKPLSGHWGILLQEANYTYNYKIGNISKLEYDLLCLITGYDYDDDVDVKFFKEYGFENTEENLPELLREFEGLLTSDAEYSSLVYQGYNLK